MMSRELLELCDHHRARRNQPVAVLVWKGARQKDLGKLPIGSSFLGLIARGSNDHPVDHLAGTLPAVGLDAAAMGVAEKEAGCFGKLSRVCGLGDPGPQQKQQGGRGG